MQLLRLGAPLALGLSLATPAAATDTPPAPPAPSAAQAPEAPPTPEPPPTPEAPATPAAPAAPPSAEPPPGAVAPEPAAPPPAAPSATQAKVEFKVNFPNGWLELRSVMLGGPWRRACPAPCGTLLEVDGMEARVTADGMTTSNPFRLQPGSGTARIDVRGGGSGWSQTGVITLAIGTPIALGGGAMFGLGRVKDSSGLELGGLITMVVGGAAIIASLPMLMSGSTTVRNYDGKLIARRPRAPGTWQF